jgi:hypothetical protein
MISFGQILVLIFLALLLFGDSRQIFNKIILFSVNMKTLFKKISSVEKKKDSTKH